MSSENLVEAKAWLQTYKDAEIGSLDNRQTKKLLTALYAAGADTVYAVNPKSQEAGYADTDTLHVSVGMMKVANVMTRLANFHPDETQLLKAAPGQHLIRAWWD